MKDKEKSKEKLITELTTLRQRIAELEASERERKQAEEALKRSEQEKAVVLGSISEYVVYQDTRMRVLWANRAAGESVGVDPQQLVGRHCYEIWQQRRKPCVGCPVVRARKSGQPQEAEITTPDGRVWFIRGYPVRGKKGNITGAVEVTREITELKQAEVALRESEERFRKFADEATFEGIILHQEGKIVDVNEQFLTMHGYERTELIGMHSLTPIAPEYRKIVRKHIQEGYEKPYEAVALKKDGSTFPIEIRGKTIPYHGKMVRVAAVRDITERKRMEQELRQSEKRFRRVVATMKVGLSTIDESGVLTYVNDYYAKMLGYSIDEMIGRPTLNFHYYEESRKEQEEIFKKRRAGLRDLTPYEVTCRRKDGQKVYSIVSPTPLFDADGHFKGSFAIHTDITERKKAEEALKQSEKRYRDLFNLISDAAYVIDQKTGRVLDVNEAACKMYGYTREEWLKMKNTDVSAEPAETRKATKETPGAIPIRYHKKKNGTVFPLEMTLNTFDLEGRKTIIVTARDITERKQADEALREKEETIRAFVETSQDWIWSIDLHGIHTYSNPAVENILGYTPGDLVGRSSLELMHDEDRQTVEANLPQWINEKRGWRNLILRWRHKDGSWRWLESSAVPIFDAAGELTGFRGVDRDITERKQAEEELKRSYEQLQETLLTTVNALTAMVEMKDRYTAGHQPRVAQLACAIAEEMGLSEEQIEGILMAGMVHDIGKIMVPAEILSKPGPLADIQYDMVKMHPQAGYDILKGIKFPWPVAQIVLQHHERMDGSGYPQGLSGEEILLEARILAVANVVEAMTAHRPYRAAHDIKEALQEISQHKEIFYDPDVVNACLKLFTKKQFAFD